MHQFAHLLGKVVVLKSGGPNLTIYNFQEEEFNIILLVDYADYQGVIRQGRVALLSTEFVKEATNEQKGSSPT